jgi:Sec-independent protein secretion pathway component TatC
MKSKLKASMFGIIISLPVLVASTAFFIQPQPLHHTEYTTVASYNNSNLDPVEQIVASQHAGHLV